MLVLAHEEDPADENHARSADNLRRLAGATDARGEPIRVVTLPYPRAVVMDGTRLPASYANFYIGNGVVIVPTFNDPADRVALGTLAAWEDETPTLVRAVEPAREPAPAPELAPELATAEALVFVPGGLGVYETTVLAFVPTAAHPATLAALTKSLRADIGGRN